MESRVKLPFIAFLCLFRLVIAISSDLDSHCFHLRFASCSVEYCFEYVSNGRGGGFIESISGNGVDAVDKCRRQFYALIEDGVYKSLSVDSLS